MRVTYSHYEWAVNELQRRATSKEAVVRGQVPLFDPFSGYPSDDPYAREFYAEKAKIADIAKTLQGWARNAPHSPTKDPYRDSPLLPDLFGYWRALLDRPRTGRLGGNFRALPGLPAQRYGSIPG